MNETSNIDKYFKDRTGHYEQQPDEALWERIAAELMPQKKKVVFFTALRIVAGMAILMMLVLGYYFLSGKQDHTRSGIVSTDQINAATNADGQQMPLTDKHSDDNSTISSSLTANHDRDIKSAVTEPLSASELLTGNSLKDQIKGSPDGFQKEHEEYITEILPFISRKKGKVVVPPDRSPGLILVHYDAPTVLSSDEYLSMQLFDDNTEDNHEKRRHWALNGEFAPLYSFRTVSSDHQASADIQKLNNAEEGLLAYAGGVRVSYAAGRRWSVQSGLYYSRYGQEKNDITHNTYFYSNKITGEISSSDIYTVTNSTGVIAVDQNADSYANTQPEMTITDLNSINSIDGKAIIESQSFEENDMTVTQTFDYLEIPLSVKYMIINRKLGFNVSGGLVTNILVDNSIIIKQNGEKTILGETNEITKVNYLCSVGIGFQYPVLTDLAFSIEPRFRYYLNSINKSAGINVHPYSFGIFAGITYTL
jgi:hypothetical protein